MVKRNYGPYYGAIEPDTEAARGLVTQALGWLKLGVARG